MLPCISKDRLDVQPKQRPQNTDIGKSFLPIDSRKLRRKKQKQNLDHIKDPDLKAELSKGSTLIKYFEQMPQ